MLFLSLKTLLSHNVSKSYNKFLFRYVRNLARRGNGPQLLEGKVKTVTEYDDNIETIENYKDFVKSVKNSKLGDELDIERSFMQDDFYGHPIERAEQYYDIHEREEKMNKSFIKKQIIKRKYFKLNLETNLLTYAAKEQIRYLHNLNSQEWNPKAISECFPISEAGAKKLLKSYFIPKDPEKIKSHDEEVAERWKMLKSGKITTEISPVTQKLYKEGKLVDDYFSGNPNFPTLPKKKIIEIERPKKIGEFSAIVQTYANHEKQKLLSTKEDCSESQLALRDDRQNKSNKLKDYSKIKNFKVEREEFDDEKTELDDSNTHKKQNLNHMDLPLSRFKEILKEENQMKMKGGNDELLNEPASKIKRNLGAIPTDSNCFLKITKYNRDNIGMMYDKSKNTKVVYKYDESLGYQYPVGKNIKGNIKLPHKLNKRGKLFKVGESVYDENGQFLYKLPS